MTGAVDPVKPADEFPEPRSIAWQRRFSLARVIFWIMLSVPAIYFGWTGVITFTAFLSLWALVATDWTAYRSDSNPHAAQLARMEKMIEDLHRELLELRTPPTAD